MKTRAKPASTLSAAQFNLIAKALADPRRVALLEAIASEAECPCERLRREFPVSKGTISHHVKELVRAGLVEANREGQYLRCSLQRDVLDAYTAELTRRMGQKTFS